MRWLRRLAALVLVVVAAGVVAGFVIVRRHLPDLQAPPLHGLSGPVAVAFDARAVPTVQAATLNDALRAQGYLVARERMFQLELQRRVASGTLSELVGAAAMPLDKIHRTYGFAHVAEEAVSGLPAEQREQLEAYAAGINAFLDAHPGRWGLELQMLGVTPRHWTPADSLLVLLLMWEDLTSSWKDELRVEMLARLPPAQQRFLMPRITDEDVLVVPDADPHPAPDAPALFVQPHATWQVAPVPPDVLGLPGWAGERLAGIGSNNWVLGPSRSKSGKAMLANDPHLQLLAPGFWYEMRLEMPPHWVQGVALTGLPGITIGQNDRIAWGFTNLGTDVQDLCREPPLTERVESIPVKGQPPVELRVPVGKHGPQVRPGYSLRWVALDPANLRIPLGALMGASDWPSFNEAIDGYTGPAQNMVYADVAGHIGWRASGLVPVRGPDDDGMRVHDGGDAGQDWHGFVPASEMPRVVDPPSGYLVTANQRLIGTSFPHLVTSDWVAPNRAQRITERIESAGKLDRDGVESIQLDVVSPFHRELAHLLAAELPEMRWLATWDGSASAESTAYLQARAWEVGLHEALQSRLLGAAGSELEWQNDQATLLAMLRADQAAWTLAGLGDRAALLAEARAAAQRWLAEDPSGTWGQRNALRIEHPIGRAGGVLAWLFNPPGFPQSGAADTVRAAGHAFGQSMRFIVDWSEPHATTLVIPLGQSGHVGSSHRTDQQPLWRSGDPGGAHTRLEQPAVESMSLVP
jgi:penicillin amidase